MNKWDVLEYLKYRFMATGVLPDQLQIEQAFPELEPDEISEGVEEFIYRVKRIA
ncbi:hypothetical protein [Thermoflavimicrobium daqui]|jgi:hypothetical protein|uniref:hypothetical protein n=1 Tax=Thermoflavimicrobium daqui TaxID=2137476 RepID=UPI00143DE8F3|nr:hypothetical protein [Thermoflavimicrobium daqui]